MSPSRRTALRLCAVALAGSVAGCSSGALDESGASATDATTTEAETETETATKSKTATETTDATTHALGVDTSFPDGSVTFPDGPKSRPERPADLTTESVRAFVADFERRWVYNELYRGESSSVRQECGVESVQEYGEGFRVVAWCTAWVNSGTGETTVHADYFTQYATYFVSSGSLVRLDGRSEAKEYLSSLFSTRPRESSWRPPRKPRPW